ncbi:MAG: chromosome segregation protein SMC [Bacterioplanes sp.]|nr:chromosome segregation protein SMC [Bacterioplanes sp.]
MRLKAIKLAGFKSFVDPTTIPFSTNMTGIVGPNGCGKSNTIDAVRWVMGESSAKYLRGDAMTDVIFNGSSERKPVGKASVELMFDNSAGQLRGEYASYAEISVRRQVTRDGQSQYFLNGTKCRRKDVTDLFLGTGLGPRSYAIIEQGMISRLIEAKPEELRVYVEEAAGISKYKERRRETEQRMRRTHENLARVQDIRDELERQLSHLQRQAQAAQTYQTLKAQEREKKAQLQALKWQQLDRDYQEREQRIARIDVEYERYMAEQYAIDAQLESLRGELHQRQDRHQRAQQAFYEVGSHIARQEQKIEQHSQLSLQLDREMADVERALHDVELNEQQDRLQLEALQQQQEAEQPELEVLAAGLEEADSALMLAEDAQQEWQAQWDAFTARASEPARLADVAQAQIQHLDAHIARLEQQSVRLQQELESVQRDSNDADLAVLAAHADELAEQVEQADSVVQQCQVQRDGLRSRIDEQRRTLEGSRVRFQQAQARQVRLQALQEAAMGQQDESLQHWLTTHQLANKPRLLSNLRVESGWELAVEAVLGDDLQALLVADVSVLEPWLSRLNSGRVTFWQGKEADTAQMNANTLASKVHSDCTLPVDLSHIFVADSFAHALSMRAQLHDHESVVTADGLWLSRHGLRVQRAALSDEGVLVRQQALDELHAELDELEWQLDEQQVALDADQLQLQSVEQQYEHAQREWQHRQQAWHTAQSQWLSQQARVEQMTLRQTTLQQELHERELQRQQAHQQRANELATKERAVALMADEGFEREQRLAEKQRCQEALHVARQRVSALKEQYHQQQMRCQGIQQQVVGLQQALVRLAAQRQQLVQRREQLLSQHGQDQGDELALLKEQLEDLLEQRLLAEQDMQEARAVLQQLEQQVRTLEQDRSVAEQQAQEQRMQLEQVRMECQALDIRRQTLVEQLQEQQLALKDVLAHMPEEADSEVWQLELQRIAERIQRLGAINLAAIEEYQIQSERQRYLTEQYADLTTALHTLEGAIQKIDQETRQRFRETFDKMNAGLADLFPKVFGGGHAFLALTDEDLLSTGVTIMARPPGKKNSTIHLLSGGEKALTAIALVFSIFQLNPAPFCMLDEVDAPLDDANVGRYARLVKAMSESVQFIYITHNKIAMEMAAQLMGVTMQEPGVSRLVSVDVTEASNMIEQSA